MARNGKNWKSRTDYELYKTRNSLIISALFFDAFTGELISLITRVNYKCGPPPFFTDGWIIWFSSYLAIRWSVLNCIYMMKTFWLYHVNIPGGVCVFLEGHPRTCLRVRALAEMQTNWLSLEYVTELRACWTDSSLFIREVTWCSGWTPSKKKVSCDPVWGVKITRLLHCQVDYSYFYKLFLSYLDVRQLWSWKQGLGVIVMAVCLQSKCVFRCLKSDKYPELMSLESVSATNYCSFLSF